MRRRDFPSRPTHGKHSFTERSNREEEAMEEFLAIVKTKDFLSSMWRVSGGGLNNLISEFQKSQTLGLACCDERWTKLQAFLSVSIHAFKHFKCPT